LADNGQHWSRGAIHRTGFLEQLRRPLFVCGEPSHDRAKVRKTLEDCSLKPQLCDLGHSNWSDSRA